MTPAADASLDVARELAGDEPVGSHHLLLAALGDPNSAAVKALAAMGVDIGQLRQALHQVDVADTSDEEPEEAGRRKMVLRLMDDRVVVEAHDDVLVAAAKEAAEVLGERAGEGGVISGGLPVTRSFAGVWQALRDSLEDIRHLAGRDGEQSA